ncbi:MAG: 50S ribosomal protein L25/general stress protein Ctc [Propionibacteriaceae bacterium]|jgi:large subunit ribosomal protein L25|nr:50S ribosomal protein L25/general stress protein Ctc [Propionibacteriaceae bacterium]
MAEITIEAVKREEFGKGASRRLRRENLIPAVLYGHGTESVHLALPAHATALALRTANALLNIEVQGDKPQLALPKAIQRDPVRDTIKHVDLIIVRRGEKVHVEVPLLIVGELKSEGVLIVDKSTLTLEAEATNIPAHIEISVDAFEVGDEVRGRDLPLPEGSVYLGDPDDVILSVQTPQAKDMGEITIEEVEEESEEEPEE